MDKKLLLDIFRIPSMSGYEDGMAYFIKEFLKEHNVPYETDKIGNVFYTRFINKPLLCAHMDTVQDTDDVKLTKFIKIRNDRILSGYGVIGGDDKCGIYIILELLKTIEFNFLFTVEEETGGVGARVFTNENDISHIPYGLILDRRGNDDIICEFNDYGTSEFETVLEEFGKPYGYTRNAGTFSDADFISNQISCANLSVGYYNWHQKDEFVDLKDLKRAFELTYRIIVNLDTSFDKPKKSLSKYSSYGNYDDEMFGMDELFLDDKLEICDFCGKQTANWKNLHSVNRIICTDCLRKLEAEIYGIECNDEINPADYNYYEGSE